MTSRTLHRDINDSPFFRSPLHTIATTSGVAISGLSNTNIVDSLQQMLISISHHVTRLSSPLGLSAKLRKLEFVGKPWVCVENIEQQMPAIVH